MGNSRWKLEELVEQAAAALADSEGDSRRVRWSPDARTARFYTTLGLLDRPAEFRGRTAYYGERHLQQLVAIKRLQASGLSLDEVQVRLAGVTPEELRELAAIPASQGLPEPAPKPAPARFWAASPADPKPQPAPAPAAAIRLAPGVTLVLDTPPRRLCSVDIASLADASKQLLDTIESLGLLDDEPGQD